MRAVGGVEAEVGELSGVQTRGFTTAWRLRDYRLLWLSSFISSCAYWALLIGRNWLVLRLSNSAGWVGLVTFATMAPFFVATPFGGILADRIDRRQLTAAMQALSLISALALAILTLSGLVQPWQVVMLAFVGGCARSVETPATSAIVPNLVRKDVLLNGVALLSVSTFGSRLFGPAAGGALQGRFGAGGVFVLTGLLWGVAALIMLAVRAPTSYMSERAKAPASFWVETKQTIHYVTHTPMISLIFLVVSLHCGLTMTVDAILPYFVQHTLRSSSGVYSLLVMGVGAGSLVGTFALAGLQSGQGKGRVLLITGIGSGVGTAMLGLSSSIGWAFAATAVMGATQGMFMALANTLLQEVLPDTLRGRVSSAFVMITGGVMSLGNLAAGFITDRVGVAIVLVTPALFFIIILLLIGGLRPNMRHIFRTGSLELVPVAG